MLKLNLDKSKFIIFSSKMQCEKLNRLGYLKRTGWKVLTKKTITDKDHMRSDHDKTNRKRQDSFNFGCVHGRDEEIQ